ncbi:MULTISPECIES: DUF11 domain-containing protein [Microbacterium]|uniref:DUF11 domain-containing protein n=1 Tax=Microbacterium oxydans TaxID=82380 RepID=A0A3Q9J6L4_9MICO|nr:MULTISPECIES: DUF11 domain-containing protein [Microbacterium]AZS38895.1 hypothetical protein CVS54_00192 [Microbacterium oxydans]
MKIKTSRTGLGIAVGSLLLGGILSTTVPMAAAADQFAPTSLGPVGVQPRGYYGAGTQTPARDVSIAPGAQYTEGATVLLRYDEQQTGVKYRVVMPVPAGSTFVSADRGGVYDAAANTVTWTFDGKTPEEAAPATQERMDFVATFRAPDGSATPVPSQTITNAATQQVMGGAFTEWRDQFTYTYNHVLAPQAGTSADLGIAKDVDKPKAAVGDTVTYTLKVTNNGPADVPSYTVTDGLPAGIDTWATSTAGAAISGGKLQFDGGSLAVGESKTVTLTGVVRAPGVTIENIATVKSGTTDSDPSNNTDNAIVEVPTKESPVPLAGFAGAAILAGAAGMLAALRRKARA